MDKSNYRQVILDFPSQFEKGLEIGGKTELPQKHWRQIIFCGMGGSALSGDLISNLYHIGHVHRFYGLPKWVNQETKPLIIAISYSGNTEETLSAYEEAKEKEFPLVAVTTGGLLKKKAENDKTPLLLIPGGIQPRAALGYLFSALFSFLSPVGSIEDDEEKLKSMARYLDVESLEKPGRIMAGEIDNKIPLIYASHNNWPIARIWKINLNETGKTHAFWNVFPEFNHNEMVGFTNLKGLPYHVIILNDTEDDPRVQKRMELTEKVMKNKEVTTSVVTLEGKNKLEKIFSSITLSSWIAYYLALNAGLDPTPVEIVEEFKKKL